MRLSEVRQMVEPIVLPYLGSYDSGDPAISSGEPLGSETTQGVECVIDRIPQYSSRPGFDSAHVTKEWTVRLIDHGGSSSDDLGDALEALLTRFPYAEADPVISSPSLGMPTQVSVRIPDRMRVGLPRR